MEELNYFKNAYVEIGNFILNALNAINIKDVESFINALINVYKNDRKVLVVGAGRSGLVGRAFAMRLMHLGFRSYVLGETITPSVGEGDLVVAISGSGTTTMVVAAAEAAKRMKAMIIAITSYRDSPLASYADLVVQVPGRTKVAKMDDYFARQILGLHEPLAPLGTLFEDTTMVLLDAVIAELMYRLKKTEDEIRMRHANIEVP
ncbi:MAG: 6-phospho-3-hexuloisomerase [Vulcanisaeta sp.]|jgi:6-phospho-3-hexuloisomerase|uniref:6-phospho 3-hexuloisomerase n=1 Tax=Vulcanisaeta moutnovskia (strain 768-28) TaxID=985053 RepID=F0QVP5_VULM7|nr:6-phospho-3-hexuloisomerase [Vulcanisaeta moutnovskia]ADY02069.1 6-phospho 3-hexuloisomerase [Vulcanisaeta moutnovskia 768-28]